MDFFQVKKIAVIITIIFFSFQIKTDIYYTKTNSFNLGGLQWNWDYANGLTEGCW